MDPNQNDQPAQPGMPDDGAAGGDANQNPNLMPEPTDDTPAPSPMGGGIGGEEPAPSPMGGADHPDSSTGENPGGVTGDSGSGSNPA